MNQWSHASVFDTDYKKNNLIDAKQFREDAEILFRETGVLSKFGSGLSLVWRYPS